MPKARVILTLDKPDVVFLDGLAEKGIAASRNALCARLIKAYRADVERNNQCPDRAIDRFLSFTQKMLGQ